MPSITSGTTDFSLDVDELIEDAFEPLGGEHISGGEARKARRKLNLLLIKLRNKGIPVSKMDNEEVTLVPGQRVYELDPSIDAVLQLNYKYATSDVETPLTRYSEKEYHQIPTKEQSPGRSSVYTTERNRDNVRLLLWPAPAEADSVRMLVSRKIEDVTAQYQRIDLPTRFLPLVSDWLAYEAAFMRVNVDPNRVALLKNKLDETMLDTFEEDRERTSFRIKPGGISGR
jgi:hypothetical protein